MTKLLNFLDDHVVKKLISDVHNVCRMKDASYFVTWHIKFVVIWTQNKQFSDTRSVHRQLSCTRLIAEWSFTYQSCDHSLRLVIPDHLQFLPADGGCVNNKCFTKSIRKLSMNKSDETYCLRSLFQLRHQLNISHLSILVQSFPYADFWMCKNY